MADELDRPSVDLTLGEALDQYLRSLKPEQRRSQEVYIRKYVEHTGERQTVTYLSGSRVESYAESQIKPSDPNAQDRVAALKAWFQFLKKKDYTQTNYGVHIRVRKTGRVAAARTARNEEPPVEMTADGIEGLKLERDNLAAQRFETVRAIETAREDGDLRENAPYHAAREQLAFTDQRIKQIDETLKRAVVVDHTSADDRSTVGCFVTVTNVATGARETYQLVGAREANAREKRISVESPVGRQLLGKRTGDIVDVELPNGRIIQYRVEQVTTA